MTTTVGDYVIDFGDPDDYEYVQFLFETAGEGE